MKITNNIVEGRRTPFYAYDMELLDATLNAVSKAAERHEFKVHYALKANPNRTIVDHIVSRGLGADCVSERELDLAIDAGVVPEKIVLAGVGKTDHEIETAIQNGIFSLNVESINELEVVEEIAAKLETNTRIALRINPNVDAKTHKFITTGVSENKFGISANEISEALNLLENSEWLSLKGIHFHIGSQILELQPFVELCDKVDAFVEEIQLRGFELDHVNLGGGLGVNYFNPDIEPIPNFDLFFNTVRENLKTDLEVHFEMGRSIVAQCGSLVTRVLYSKRSAETEFLIVDAGMTELMRPALYGASHKIERIDEPVGKSKKYSIVGPVCESTDCFARGVELPESERGDVLLIRSSGAYGESMASNYNLRSLNKPLFVESVTAV